MYLFSAAPVFWRMGRIGSFSVVCRNPKYRPGPRQLRTFLSSQKTEDVKIALRPANTLYQASGMIQDGTFRGRWHFSFDMYSSPRYNNFGNLRVLNDDTLSPGAVWPLHPHTQNEVVTYVAEGSFVTKTSVVRVAFSTREECSTRPWVVEYIIRRSTTGGIFRCGSSRYGICPKGST